MKDQVRDSLFLFGAALIGYGLYKIHPSLCFLFGGLLLWLTAYTATKKKDGTRG
jgi:hypothetical protein